MTLWDNLSRSPLRQLEHSRRLFRKRRGYRYNIRPYKVAAGKATVQTMEDRFAYGLNPKKIGAVSAYLCDPASAPAEFLLTKSQYQAETGRAVERGALFFQIRQAFPPVRLRRRRQTKSAMKQPCAGQRVSTNFSSVPTSTKGTFIITFITIPRPSCSRKFHNFIGSNFCGAAAL